MRFLYLSALAEYVAVSPVLVAGRPSLGEHVRDVERRLVELEGRDAGLVVSFELAAQLARLGVLVFWPLAALAGLHPVGFAD